MIVPIGFNDTKIKAYKPLFKAAYKPSTESLYVMLFKSLQLPGYPDIF